VGDFADFHNALSCVTETAWLAGGRLIALQMFSSQGLALAALRIRGNPHLRMPGCAEMQRRRDAVRGDAKQLAGWDGQTWLHSGIKPHLARVFVDAGAARDVLCALAEARYTCLENLLLALSSPWDRGLQRTNELHVDAATGIPLIEAVVVEQYAGLVCGGSTGTVCRHTVMWCSSIEAAFLANGI
jgi:hypothetical protein